MYWTLNVKHEGPSPWLAAGRETVELAELDADTLADRMDLGTARRMND